MPKTYESLEHYRRILPARAQYFTGLIKRAIGSDSNKWKRYVDLACGYGTNTTILGKFLHPEECVCLDLDRHKLVETRSKLEQACMQNHHLILADAENIPLRNQSIDIVSAFSIIQFLKGQNAFVTEIARLMKNKGILILQFPNANSLVEIHTAMPLPFIIPQKIKNSIVKRNLGWSSFHIKNLSGKRALEMLRKHFRIEGLFMLEYQLELIPQRFKILYELYQKLRLSYFFPLAYLIICIKVQREAIHGG